MNNMDELGYFSKTVSDGLGVKPDTLRSWALKLEDEGIEFKRDEHNNRIYYEKDIRAFRNMKELLDLQQPMKAVVPIVAEKIKEGLYDGVETENNTLITAPVIRDNHDLITHYQRMEQSFFEVFKQMKQEQTETMQRIEEQSKKTDEKIDLVLEELKKEREEKQLLHEKLQKAVELLQEAEDKEMPQEEKKGFFKRLFGG